MHIGGNNSLNKHRAVVPATEINKCRKKCDFVSEYVKYANVTEAHEMAHEAVALSFVATILNRNGVIFMDGPVEVPMDVWMTLLSGSGGGRNTLINIGRNLLLDAGLGNFLIHADFGSVQAMAQEVSERLDGLFIWPEFSTVLHKLNTPQFGNAKPWLTDCYDEFTPPPPIKYRQTGRATDLKAIEFTKAPRLNILSASSREWFYSSVDQADIMGGFLTRFIIVDMPETFKVISRMQESKPSLQLLKTLRTIANLNGVATFSNAANTLYDDWYKTEKMAAYKHPNTALAQPIFNRQRRHVQKLAVIFEVSMSQKLVVSPKAMQRAIKFVKRLDTGNSPLTSALSRVSCEVQKIEDYVLQAGDTGRMRSEVTYQFKNMKGYERDAHIKTLLDSGKIHSKWLQTGGRKAETFFHAKHRVRPRTNAKSGKEVVPSRPRGKEVNLVGAA